MKAGVDTLIKPTSIIPDMKKTLTLMLALLGATELWAQTADTLSFFSKAFNEPRTVYVIKPEFYKY